MTPETVHKDDLKWVQQQLARIPYAHHAKVCQGYSKAWQEAHDAEPLMHCKENAGRFAANSRLRNYVKKVQDAMNGNKQLIPRN